MAALMQACGTPAGSGKSNQCSNQCDIQKKLGCIGETSGDLAECKDTCLKRIKGATSKSVSEVTVCMTDSVSCGQADSCYSKLEDAPIPVNNAPGRQVGGETTGGMGDNGSTGAGGETTGGSGTGSTPPGGSPVNSMDFSNFTAAYCGRYAKCTSEDSNSIAKSADYCSIYMNSVVGPLTSILNFGAEAQACAEEMNCSDMVGPDMSSVLPAGCIGLKSMECMGSNGQGGALKACNTENQCVNLDCQALCAEVSNGKGQGTCGNGMSDMNECRCE